jgi:DNA-binding transcriptional LysR family regulator
MTTMDLNLLPTFVAVAEARSFTEAARKLGLPRSSVSRAVTALEGSLRVQLFSRTTRQVALTTAGSLLHSKLAPELAAVAEAIGSLPERDQVPSGELRLTAPNDIGGLLLPAVVVGFCQRHPSVRLDVRLTNRTVDLVAEGFDAALRVSTRKLQDSSLIARRVTGVEMQVYASPTYLARAGTPKSPADAAEHEWVSFRGLALPPALSRLKSKPRITADDLLFMHQAVRHAAGLGILPTFLVADDVAAGRLVRVLPRLSVGMGSVYLIHPAAQHVPRKVLAFREYLVEYLSLHPMSAR